MKTIKLPIKIAGEGEVKGFTFNRLMEGDGTYLYEVESIHDTKHYEVIKRHATPILIDFEKKILSTDTVRERYPKAKDWGTRGWTFLELKKACQKFRELENEIRIKSDKGV